MVEGARLESVYAGNRIAGSNPASSAIRMLYLYEIKVLFDFKKIATLALALAANMA